MVTVLSRVRDPRRSVAVLGAIILTLAIGAGPAVAEMRVPLWSATVKPSNGGEASSVAVDPSGQTVFVAGHTDLRPFSFLVAAYDTATGVRAWRQTYPCSTVAKQQCFDATLALSPDGSTVFLAGEIGTGPGSVDWIVMALDPTTAVQRWTTRMPGQTYAAGASLNIVVSPVGDRLFLAGSTASTDRYTEAVQAIDAATGAALWRREFWGFAYEVAPLGISPDGRQVFVAVGEVGRTSDLRIRAFGSASGALIWKRSFGARSATDMVTDLTVDPSGRRIYLTDYRTALGGCCEVVLRPVTMALRAGTGARVWQRFEGMWSGNMVLEVAASVDRVFVADGSGVQSRDARTGQALWSRKTVTIGKPGTYWLDYGFHLAVSNDGQRVFITEGLGKEASTGWADRVETVALIARTGHIRWTALRVGIWWGAIAVDPADTMVFVAGGLIGSGDTYRGMLLLTYAT